MRSCFKTGDTVYMTAKGKVIYKITPGSTEFETLTSDDTGVGAVIQGAVLNPGTTEAYLLDDEGCVWRYDVVTGKGEKITGFTCTTDDQPIYKSHMSSISKLDLKTVLGLETSAAIQALTLKINEILSV